MPYIVIAFGLILGSFFNVVIFRLPNNQSILTPGSHCPKCSEPVRAYDNIPILSYIFLRGKCRFCGKKISLRYPFIEALTAFLFWLSFYHVGFNLQLIPAIFLVSICLVVTFIDLDYYIIPDRITYPGMILGIGFSLLPGGIDIWQSLIGFLAGGVTLYIIAIVGDFVFKKESMGGGDIKLAALIGAFVGWQGVLLTLVISSFVGAVGGMLMLALLSRDDETRRIPYGPFLAIGAIISYFWGNDIIGLYLSYIAGFR
ncbi:MAG: prepilin peptidase [candidate division Zixibacteria bacterium]|nr:prepilin peptidase [candidate division Zixibacteria bacterium]